MPRIALLLTLLISLQASADAALCLVEARKVASKVPPKLLQVLEAEIAKGGPESAIGACREKAPAMTKVASAETGWNIRRVSLRNCGPKAVPDIWERLALEDFDRRAAAGEGTATLEGSEIVGEAGCKEYRYMKALPMQPIFSGLSRRAGKSQTQSHREIAGAVPDRQGRGLRSWTDSRNRDPAQGAVSPLPDSCPALAPSFSRSAHLIRGDQI